jgi:hypothetical protein
MNTPRFNSVEDALASLPRSVLPARDLWPAISRELAAPPAGVALASGATGREAAPRFARTPWPMALAASLAVASLAGALCWSVWRERPADAIVASSTPAPITARTLVNYEPLHDAEYVSARADLEQVFNERLKLLAPATRVRIQADLETIRKANADIRAALAKDPASPLLLKLLQNTGQQEIDLYTSVAQTTEPMLARRT